MKRDVEYSGRFSYASTTAHSGDKMKHGCSEQGFWSVTIFVAKYLVSLFQFHSLAHHQLCQISTPHHQRTPRTRLPASAPTARATYNEETKSAVSTVAVCQ